MKQNRKFIGCRSQSHPVWTSHSWAPRTGMLWAFSILTLLLAAGLVLSRWQAAAGQSVPANSGYANADQIFIQGLQRALSSSRLNDADRQALQKKLAYSERLVEQRTVKPQAHQPKGPLIPPVPMPTAAMQPGSALQPDMVLPAEQIIPGSEGLVHPWEASINNLWEGTYNGIAYQVLAGAAPDDPLQGMVIVIESSPNQGPPFQQTYRTPAHSGALRIAARQNSRLQCAAMDGSTLFFDLEARTFQP